MRRLLVLLRRFRRRSDGSTLVEFALTLPALLGMLLGLTQMCLAFYTWQMISECAREGTRYAMVHGSTCETSAGASCTLGASDINSYVQSIGLPNVGGGTVTASTSYPDGAEVPGDRVQVTVTYSLPYNIPMIPSHTLSMSSTSVMYIIQ